jgi:hypothetical protein
MAKTLASDRRSAANVNHQPCRIGARKMHLSFEFSKAFVLSLIFFTFSANAEIRVVAVSGERAPDNSGELSELSSPVLRASGTPFFTVAIRENGFFQKRITLRSGPQLGNLSIVAAQGQPSPDSNGFFPALNDLEPFVNSQGDSAFDLTLENALSAPDTIFMKPASGAIRILLRSGSPIPGDPKAAFGELELLDFNNARQAVFFSFAPFVSPLAGIWRVSDTGIIAKIASTSDLNPITGRPFISISRDLMMNDTGEVAFSGSSDGFPSFFRSSGGSIAGVAANGALAPGGGAFSLFGAVGPVINNSGAIAFVSRLTNSPLGTVDDSGLFLSTPQGISQRIRKGTFLPDGNGRYLVVGTENRVALNDSGEVVLIADITGASNSSNQGLLISRPGGVQIIARVGATAPGGGTFSSFTDSFSINSLGDVAFIASVRIAQLQTITGLFIYRNGEVKSIARPGTPVVGYGNITSVSRQPRQPHFRSRSWLDDAGNVTFAFLYTGGNSAIALWSEPGFTPGESVFRNGFE